MKNILILLIFFLRIPHIFAQIIPPGLGETHTASWFAMAATQDLDTLDIGGWQSFSYVGVGRMSNPDNYNPAYKPAIFILYQEFRHRLRNHWEYALAASYSKQNVYTKSWPYKTDDPPSKLALGVSGKLYHTFKMGSVEITPGVRQDAQKYFAPGFGKYHENLKFRTRPRLKLTIPLTENFSHRISFYSEQLFSVSKIPAPEYWTSFKYTESRFSLYYSWSARKIPFSFDIGYMNNLIDARSPVSVHYLSIDVVWKNPLTPKK